MRASATSRIASPAGLPSTQSKADANTADETSPFALLVGSTQPAATKPAQKNTQESDNKNSSTKNDGANQENKPAASQPSTSSPAPSSGQTGKTQASGKSNGKPGDSNDDGNQLSSANQQPIDPQTLPTVQMPAQQLASLAATSPAITDANDDTGGDEPDVTAAGAAGVAASGQAKAPAGQNTRNTQDTKDTRTAQAADNASIPQTAGQAQAPGNPNAQPDSVQTAGQAQAPGSPNAKPDSVQTVGQAQAPGSPTAQPDGVQTAGQAQAPDSPNAEPDGVQTAGQAQAPGSANAQPDGVQTAKPWQAKTQSASGTNSTKADSSQAGDAKVDDVRQAAAPAPQAMAASDTPVAKPAEAASNAVPVIAGSAPQTQQTQGSAPHSITQNVQVSTPTPNMPALAVEITAKSQSGAKQFDIRLDPPELGRVEVRLSIDATGKASAHLSADQPQTLDLLQKDAPALTRALRDAGLNVSQNGLNFSLRQQSSDAGAGSNQGRGGNGRTFTLSATSSIDATSASAVYRTSADGRLDIRV